MSGTKILSAEVSEFEIAIDVTFDNYMTPDDALINPANYTFDNGAYSRLVDILDINKVRIWVELFYNNLSFTLTVSNVTDGYGYSILPPDNSIIISPFYSTANITNYNGKVRTWHDSSFISADSQRVYLAGTKGIDVFRKLTPTSFLRWAQIYDAYGIDSMFVANFPNDIVFSDQDRPTVTNLDPNIADFAMPSTHITFDILDLSTAVEITEVKVYINSEIAFRGDYGGWYNDYSGNINIGYKKLSFDIWPSINFIVGTTITVRVFAKDLIGLYVDYSYIFYIVSGEFGFGEFGFIPFGGEGLGPYVPPVPPVPGATQVWVGMAWTLDGIWQSTDAGASFVNIDSDASWYGFGYMHANSVTRIVCNVGKDAGGSNFNPIAVYNGSEWTVDTSLESVESIAIPWCSSDEIFLVHSSYSDRAWRRYSGSSWSVIDTLVSGKKYVYMHGVSNSAVFACGSISSGSGHFVKRWNGSAIDQIYTSSSTGFPAAVFAVSAASVWYAWTRSSDSAIVIEHWDGGAWTETHDTVYGTSANAAPTAMWFADADNGWLVTDGWADDGGPILYWNGLTWASQTLPAGVVQFEGFYSISGTSATDVYATSIHGTNCHLLHFDGATWSDVTPVEWEALDLGGVVAFAG